MIERKRCNGRHWADAEVKRLKREISKGKSAREVAEKLGRTESAIRNRIVIEGISIRLAKQARKTAERSG